MPRNSSGNVLKKQLHEILIISVYSPFPYRPSFSGAVPRTSSGNCLKGQLHEILIFSFSLRHIFNGEGMSLRNSFMRFVYSFKGEGSETSSGNVFKKQERQNGELSPYKLRYERGDCLFKYTCIDLSHYFTILSYIPIYSTYNPL